MVSIEKETKTIQIAQRTEFEQIKARWWELNTKERKNGTQIAQEQNRISKTKFRNTEAKFILLPNFQES